MDTSCGGSVGSPQGGEHSTVFCSLPALSVVGGGDAREWAGGGGSWVEAEEKC